MAGCENCFFGGKKIGYKGPLDSPFVIVGESPGIMEIAKGEPFVGPSGQLLEGALRPFKSWLTANGCEPFITNAFHCLPREKDPARVAAACQRCHPRLVSEITAYPRKLIVALGNAALQSLTGNYSLKITQVRGTIFESPYAELGILAAVHPAFLLRGGGNMQQFNRDFSLAVNKLGYIEQESKTHTTVSGVFKPSEYTVLETEEAVAELAAKLKTVSYVAADIETDGFDPLYGQDVNPPHTLGKGILCMGVSISRSETYVIPGELLTNELFQNDAKWCWHNGKFDISWLRHYGFKDARVDDDTMLLSYLLNERGGVHDLEQVGSDWLQAPNYKDMLEKGKPSKKHSYAYIPADLLHKYQAIDTNLTFWLRDVLRAKVMADPKLSRVYTEILIPASEFLHRLERTGFAVDFDKLDSNQKRLSALANKYETTFCALAEPFGFGTLNPRSPVQLKEFLYGALKLGRVSDSTDFDTITMLLHKQPAEATTVRQLLSTLLDYRGVHKQLSTYVNSVREKAQKDGRIHTTFKLHGTTTGRLSSSKPNIQNIPRDKDIRGQFIAREGCVLLECDLAQAELRMLACLSNDEEMCRIFNSGISLHDEVATYLFGDGFNKEQKMIAKNVNFGIVYGITNIGLQDQIEVGAAELGSAVHVTAREAQEWIDGWMARFPQAAAFIERCRNAPLHGQTIVSPFGRKRRFTRQGFDHIKDLQNEAANFPHQSGAHDITLITGIEVQPVLNTEWDTVIVNEVHDCLVSEVPDDMSIIIPVAQRIIQTMEDVPVRWGLTRIPFKAEAEVGTRWGSCEKFDPFKYTDLTDLKGITYEQAKKQFAAALHA